MNFVIEFSAQLWKYKGDGAWFFITIPKEYVADIKAVTPTGIGFGAIKVNATIGAVTWQTSVFPDKKSGSYLMPIKKDVRTQLGIQEDDSLNCKLEFIQI